jgi:hypothetical protein
MKCDVCDNFCRGIRPSYCNHLILCNECASVELVKTTEDKEEMIVMIKLSKKEARKKLLRSKNV